MSTLSPSQKSTMRILAEAYVKTERLASDDRPDYYKKVVNSFAGNTLNALQRKGLVKIVQSERKEYVELSDEGLAIAQELGFIDEWQANIDRTERRSVLYRQYQELMNQKFLEISGFDSLKSVRTDSNGDPLETWWEVRVKTDYRRVDKEYKEFIEISADLGFYDSTRDSYSSSFVRVDYTGGYGHMLNGTGSSCLTPQQGKQIASIYNLASIFATKFGKWEKQMRDELPTMEAYIEANM